MLAYYTGMRKVIVVKRTLKKGLGVFALKDFKEREIIESCPVLIFDTKGRRNLEKTKLSHYIYPWRSTRGAALVLGFGSIYNHWPFMFTQMVILSFLALSGIPLMVQKETVLIMLVVFVIGLNSNFAVAFLVGITAYIVISYKLILTALSIIKNRF